MPGATAIAIAGLVVSSIGVVASVVGQQQAQKSAAKRAREAAAARQRAEDLQKKRDDIQAARQRRRAVAESRRFTSQAVNLAANRGAGGSIGASGSTVAGVTANLQSQLNFNNAFINRVTDLNQGIRSAFGQAQDIASRPITAGSGLMAFGGLARSAGSFAFANAKGISSYFGSGGGGGGGVGLAVAVGGDGEDF
jgi:choline dehydrogenase-like flavoprotein